MLTITARDSSYNVLPVDQLLRPKHVHPHVNTSADYQREQMLAIQAKLAAFHQLQWRLPWRYTGKRVPLKVSDSCWQLVCQCGNCPAYDPEWKLACCYTCGAIYEQAPPRNWRAIERVLVNRPKLGNRHMLPGQTLTELKRENREHGDPV